MNPPRAALEARRFATPWSDWKPYCPILLSGERGERRLTDIAVHETPPRDFDELVGGAAWGTR
jgi:hypothetical protein